MIRISLRLSTDAQQTDAVAQALRLLMRQAQAEESCIRCELLEVVESPEILLYIEEWSTVEDVERQIRSERIYRLLLVMEEASCPPKLEFALVPETRGLEYVEAVRGDLPVDAWAGS